MLRNVLLGVGVTCALVSLSPTAARGAAADIVLTAADVTDLHGHWSRHADASAAGGHLLASRDDGWSQTSAALPAPAHYADFTFTAEADTPYRVWLRLRAPGGTKYNDSVFVQFSHALESPGKPRYRIGTDDGLLVNLQGCNGCPLEGWGWANGAYWLQQQTTLTFATSGSQTLRVQTREDGVEIDQIVLSPAAFLSHPPGAARNDHTHVAHAPRAASSPVNGVPIAIPGIVRAEMFDNGGRSVAYHDSTPNNLGRVARDADVDLQSTPDGGYALAWVTPGEWLNYAVDVSVRGVYIFEASVASAGPGGTFHVNAGDRNVTGSLRIPDTGDWQAYRTIATVVSLEAGPQTLRVVFDGHRPGDTVGNLAWMRLTPHRGTPFTTTAATLPGAVAVESFDAAGPGISYFDTTPGNSGGQFRQTDVDIAGSASAGYYITDIAEGEWLEYAVSVAKGGDYLLQFEAASTTGTARVRTQFDLASVPPVAVPATGGAPHWTTVQVPVSLTQGEQVMRLTFEGAGLAVRAVRVVPASTTFVVPAGASLQAALNQAQPGDTILLEPGATYVGNFVLPARTGDRYITIRSSAPDAALPAEGVRITPADAAFLPKLRSPNSSPALATAPGAHHYRLQFLEFLANAQGAGSIIALGDGSSKQNTLDVVPHSLIVDRVYVHGDPTVGQKRGIALNSAATTIVNSYISEIKAVGQDSQAIGGWNGPGPYLISNNYLEAAGENVMFGGADPAIPGLVPSDITFTHNHLFKPLSWRGSSWSVKNLFELKNAQRVLVAGNLFENNWVAAQAGYAILLKSVNQDGRAPWSVVRDVLFTNNIVRHVSSGVNILGRDTRYPAVEASHITIRNNVFDDVSGARYGGAGRFLLVNGGEDITIDHNTVVNDGSSTVYATGRPSVRFVFTNNVLRDNAYGIKGDGTSPGSSTIATWFPGGQFFGGIFVGSKPSQYPTANFYPATVEAVGFVDYPRGDYRLSSSSIYRGGATDGTDPGARFEDLAAALGAAR